MCQCMGMCDCDLEPIPTKTSYIKFEYQKAKAFIKDAVIVQRFSTPTFTSTVYIKDGQRWQEFESHLESPYDDYSLNVVKS